MVKYDRWLQQLQTYITKIRMEKKISISLQVCTKVHIHKRGVAKMFTL